jgi:hypothetical protein
VEEAVFFVGGVLGVGVWRAVLVEDVQDGKATGGHGQEAMCARQQRERSHPGARWQDKESGVAALVGERKRTARLGLKEGGDVDF